MPQPPVWSMQHIRSPEPTWSDPQIRARNTFWILLYLALNWNKRNYIYVYIYAYIHILILLGFTYDESDGSDRKRMWKLSGKPLLSAFSFSDHNIFKGKINSILFSFVYVGIVYIRHFASRGYRPFV